MATPHLLGIAGRARSGKDTLARWLCHLAGYRRIAFADPLKREVADFLGITVGELEDKKALFRATLQYRGTEFWRRREPMHWIYIVADQMQHDSIRGAQRWVIPDVRYRNEADWIHGRGGMVVRMVRVGQCPPGKRDHVSETEMESIQSDITYTCRNIEEIEQCAKRFLRESGAQPAGG